MAKQTLPTLGLLYLDYVLRFFDKSNFRGWPNKIEQVTFHWGNDKARLIKEIKRKKIDVLIGNIPATAYETFREISEALPHVRFVPSLDTQFSNKSKENVTRFAWKYKLPVPKTHIFYDREKGTAFLKKTSYPKIVKKSYGPSNYGGYFVHKVDNLEEAQALFATKKYHPMYVQDFIPMHADIRVMLIGHKPVCAFWRRPPKGKWLTNTSQGGQMDYQDVPKKVLDLAVNASKAANAEYWACDVAYGKDNKVRILECATAFAAFPYIRDWIGQYIMWKFGQGRFPKPHIPVYNWEELSKIDSSLLRTMRYITFGAYSPSYDGAYFGKKKKVLVDGEYYLHALDQVYTMEDTTPSGTDEWPSEKWNFQGRFALESLSSMRVKNLTKGAAPLPSDETEESAVQFPYTLRKKELKELLTSIKGLGEKKFSRIMDTFGNTKAVITALEQSPSPIATLKGITPKIEHKITAAWQQFKQEDQ
jgi:glutathione synthase/RimK-type ligase-like ATP-grasp enzyme